MAGSRAGGGRFFAGGLLSRALSYMLQVSLPPLAAYYYALPPRLVGISLMALWASGGAAVMLVAYWKSRGLLLASLLALPAASALGLLGGYPLLASFVASYFLVSAASAYLAPSSFISEGQRGTALYTAGLSAGVMLGVALQMVATGLRDPRAYAVESIALSAALAAAFPIDASLGEAKGARGATAAMLGSLMKEELAEFLSVGALSAAVWPLLTAYAEVFAMDVLGLGAPLAVAGMLLASAASLASRLALSRTGGGRRALYASLALTAAGVIALSAARGAPEYLASTALVGLGHGLQMPIVYSKAFEHSRGSEAESYVLLNAEVGAGEFMASALGTALIAALGFRAGLDAFLAAAAGASAGAAIALGAWRRRYAPASC